MPMKKIFALLSFAACCAFAGGCSEKEDVLGKQKSDIVSFLERTHQPRLIPEEQYEEGSRAGLYATLGDAVYRYIDIDDYYAPDRESRPEVTESSWVTVTFRAYLFRNAVIRGLPDGGLTPGNIADVTLPFYTNDPAFATYLELVGLTPGLWNFEPLRVDMRNPGIIKGFALALLGCREGDRVESYMTYDVAYGNKTYMYMIPKETPVAIFFEVDKVE